MCMKFIAIEKFSLSNAILTTWYTEINTYIIDITDFLSAFNSTYNLVYVIFQKCIIQSSAIRNVSSQLTAWVLHMHYDTAYVIQTHTFLSSHRSLIQYPRCTEFGYQAVFAVHFMSIQSFSSLHTNQMLLQRQNYLFSCEIFLWGM